MDYTGKQAPARIRVANNNFSNGIAALRYITALLSTGSFAATETSTTNQIAITDDITNNAINYNVYRLTLVDNVDTTHKEYVYIPSANLSLLTNQDEGIPSTSSLFSAIKSSIENVYISNENNSCTLTAIEYITQRNTIFPTQVNVFSAGGGDPGSITTIALDITATENGSYSYTPPENYAYNKVRLTVNVPTSGGGGSLPIFTGGGFYGMAYYEGNYARRENTFYYTYKWTPVSSFYVVKTTPLSLTIPAYNGMILIRVSRTNPNSVDFVFFNNSGTVNIDFDDQAYRFVYLIGNNSIPPVEGTYNIYQFTGIQTFPGVGITTEITPSTPSDIQYYYIDDLPLVVDWPEAFYDPDEPENEN